MPLPRGVTGFWRASDRPIPLCDLAVFRAACHAAARSLRGRMTGFQSPSSPLLRNFAVGLLELPGREVAVLLNAHHPIVGFAEPDGEAIVNPRFLDEPRLAGVIRSFGPYDVYTSTELERAIEAGDLERLAPAELKQWKYWKPERVGDLIFNYWD